jgi:hypothetical protein
MLWGEVSDTANPGIIRADPVYQKDTLFRAQSGPRFLIFGSGFRVPMEVVSTSIENNVLNGYLAKITILIIILPCNLAGFCWHHFLAFIIAGFSGDSGCKCPWQSAIAITSENPETDRS